MTFATLYFEEGNLLNFHEDRAEARDAVLAVIARRPDVADDLGLVKIDADGRRVGDFISGQELRTELERETGGISSAA